MLHEAYTLSGLAALVFLIASGLLGFWLTQSLNPADKIWRMNWYEKVRHTELGRLARPPLLVRLDQNFWLQWYWLILPIAINFGLWFRFDPQPPRVWLIVILVEVSLGWLIRRQRATWQLQDYHHYCEKVAEGNRCVDGWVVYPLDAAVSWSSDSSIQISFRVISDGHKNDMTLHLAVSGSTLDRYTMPWYDGQLIRVFYVPTSIYSTGDMSGDGTLVGIDVLSRKPQAAVLSFEEPSGRLAAQSSTTSK
jgi:hypothetical protein